MVSNHAGGTAFREGATIGGRERNAFERPTSSVRTAHAGLHTADEVTQACIHSVVHWFPLFRLISPVAFRRETTNAEGASPLTGVVPSSVLFVVQICGRRFKACASCWWFWEENVLSFPPLVRAACMPLARHAARFGNR